MKNRRKYKRLNFNYMVWYRMAGIDNNYHLAALRNISNGGVLFTTDKRLNEGSIIELELNILEEEKVAINAKIVRVVKVKRRIDYYNIGVEFSTADVDKETLNRIIGWYKQIAYKEDKRSKPRIDVHYLVWYKSNKNEKYRYRLVALRNLSTGGAYFTTDENLDIGSKIQIELNVPSEGKLILPAEVLRTSSLKRHITFYNIAIKFTPLPIHRGSIEYINHIIEKKLAISE